MSAAGLVISAAGPDDDSAYSHRLRELAKGLQLNSILCDFFFMPDHALLRKVTSSSLFLPLWLPAIRKYDFIHCGDEEATQAMFFCRPFYRGIIVYDMHGDVVAQAALRDKTYPSARHRRDVMRARTFERMAMTVADHVLCVSTPQVNWVVSRGSPAGAVSLVRNGVDLDFFRPLPQPREPRFDFAYVGDFQVWQGIGNLIEAFRRIKSSSPRLLVVGFRESDEPTKRMFAEEFGSRVQLVDRTDRQTIMELLKDAAIMVIPRIRHEAIEHAFPTKFAEYAALGRPILVNDVDETADFVKRYDCGFVSGTSGESMAETMEAALDYSPEALAEMGGRARIMAEENFSWTKIGSDYAQIVQRLTATIHRRTDGQGQL
jgi:glycosyltransferase involved in cell wall biosynthesis